MRAGGRGGRARASERGSRRPPRAAPAVAGRARPNCPRRERRPRTARGLCQRRKAVSQQAAAPFGFRQTRVNYSGQREDGRAVSPAADCKTQCAVRNSFRASLFTILRYRGRTCSPRRASPSRRADAWTADGDRPRAVPVTPVRFGRGARSVALSALAHAHDTPPRRSRRPPSRDASRRSGPPSSQYFASPAYRYYQCTNTISPSVQARPRAGPGAGARIRRRTVLPRTTLLGIIDADLRNTAEPSY